MGKLADRAEDNLDSEMYSRWMRVGGIEMVFNCTGFFNTLPTCLENKEEERTKTSLSSWQFKR